MPRPLTTPSLHITAPRWQTQIEAQAKSNQLRFGYQRAWSRSTR